MFVRSEFKLNGPGVLAHQLAKGLRDRGVEVVAASSGGGMAEAMEVEGFLHVTVPSLAVNRRGLLDSLRSIRSLGRMIREQEVDLVHGFNGAATMLAAFAGMGRVKAVTTVLGVGKEWFYWFGPRRLLAVSQAVRSRLIRAGIGERRISVVNPGVVDTVRFDPRKYDRQAIRTTMGIAPSERVAAYVAVMAPGKGHEMAIQVASQVVKALPSFRLLMIGDGPERPKVEALIQELGLGDHVILAGYQTDVPPLLNTADILLHLPVQETFGIVLIEANAMEKPVVATAVGGIPEVLSDGETGVLVPPGDVRAATRAVLGLLDPAAEARRNAMGAAGRRRVEEKYTLSRTVDNLLKVYREAGIS